MIKLILGLFVVCVVSIAQAKDKSCRLQVQKYKSCRDQLLKCLDDSKIIKDCESRLAEMIDEVKAIHDCLPIVPSNQGTGGGYDANKSITSYSGCDSEANALKNDGLYDCIAEWNYSASENFRLELPKANCISLVSSFITKRISFQECLSSKYPGKDAKMKIRWFDVVH